MEQQVIKSYLAGSVKAIESISNKSDTILGLVRAMCDVLRSGGCIYWVGNGGSAADAQHLAAELVGRFEIDRKPLKSIALTTDTSILTAIGNDFGYEQVFSRQIEAVVNKNDLIVFISTSGKSKNIVEGLREAKRIGCKTAIFTGRNKVVSDFSINIEEDRTCHIQEGHIVTGQLICMMVEIELQKS
jgi:D-sedoheptulose 7-phosphate isomerase